MRKLNSHFNVQTNKRKPLSLFIARDFMERGQNLNSDI